MRTYQNFQLRKWFRAHRCKRCRGTFEAGPSALYCGPCSRALLADAPRNVVAPKRSAACWAMPCRSDAHFIWIDAMARDQHGRAMLSDWQLAHYEARLALGPRP